MARAKPYVSSFTLLSDIPFPSNMTAVYLTDHTGPLLWGLVSSLPQGGQHTALPCPPLLNKLFHVACLQPRAPPVTAGLPLGRRPDRMVQNIVTGVKKVETMLLKSNRSPSSTSVLPTAMGGEAARPAQWEVTAARPGALRGCNCRQPVLTPGKLS